MKTTFIDLLLLGKFAQKFQFFLKYAIFFGTYYTIKRCHREFLKNLPNLLCNSNLFSSSVPVFPSFFGKAYLSFLLFSSLFPSISFQVFSYFPVDHHLFLTFIIIFSSGNFRKKRKPLKVFSFPYNS